MRAPARFIYVTLLLLLAVMSWLPSHHSSAGSPDEIMTEAYDFMDRREVGSQQLRVVVDDRSRQVLLMPEFELDFDIVDAGFFTEVESSGHGDFPEPNDDQEPLGFLIRDASDPWALTRDAWLDAILSWAQ